MPVLIKELKPFLDAVARQCELYVPKRSGEHYVFTKYDPSGTEPEFNNIRVCTPVKEFLFPMRHLAAVFPDSEVQTEVAPFAVFGLKDCDLRSIEILDQVFLEDDFLDPSYAAHRKSMFIISADCFDPAESCCCSMFDGEPFSQSGFDLNVAKVEEGFIIEAGSEKGENFLEKNRQLFADVPAELISRRDEQRAKTKQQLEKINKDYELDADEREIVDSGQESDVFDVEARHCIECQACTRVCPTCHCFYLMDSKNEKYFSKMKMWDSCMRLDYARVAGGENPRKMLGERLKHRLMHKFVYFLDRCGMKMCVGCGRCIDADAGGIDIRKVLKKLNEELKTKQMTEVTK